MDGARESPAQPPQPRSEQSSNPNHPNSTVRRSSRLSISTTPADLSFTANSRGKRRVTIEEASLLSTDRNQQAQPSSLSVPDPEVDRKGKKRVTQLSASAETPPTKRPKRSSASSAGSSATKRYELRAKPEDQASAASVKEEEKNKNHKNMPSKSNSRKGSGLGSLSERGKKGDTSARQLVGDEYNDEDDSLWIDEPEGDMTMGDESDMADEYDHEEDDEDDEDADGDENGDNDGPGGGFGNSAYDRLARLASESGVNLDDATAALFGSGFRAFGGLSSGLSNRLRRLKKKLHSKRIATRLAALRECSELLLVSNEDTLGGTFSPTSFATEFVAILDGRPNIEEGESEEEESVYDDMDEDAQLAAALALSSGGPSGTDGEEDEMECQLVACRCLAHLMEALPGCGHALVQIGAVPVLCSKLTEISYIELAEQTLSTLEKLSAEYPSAVVREGGLGALLNFLPFFSTNVQRTAVTAAANCCRNISSEHFPKIKEVFPTLRDTLSSGDPRLVEQATLAIVRTTESYRHNADHLEGLLDVPTVTAINALLLPSGGSPLITPSTYTHLLKALTTSARGSAKVSIALLEAGMVNSIYQILTGVLPSSIEEGEYDDSSNAQGLAGSITDMAVLQNLSHRPKEQVEEAFLCAIISSKDNDAFVLHALQIVELLATKLPDVYQVSFLREGVVYEIEALANSEMKKEKAAKEATKSKSGEVDNAGSRPSTPSNPPGASEIPSDLRSFLALSGVSNQILFGQTSGHSTPRKSSSQLDSYDANIIRARILMAKKIFDTGGDNQKVASKVLANISDLVKRLCEPEASEADLREVLRETASQFSSVEQSLSSFELLQSGLVDGLLDFVKIHGRVSPTDRQAMLFDTFSDKSLSNPNPLTILVKRLHESLGRLENFDVETAFGGGSDPSRPSTSSVHRTMRIRLMADEGEDIPKSVTGRSGGAPGSSTSRLLNALAGNPDSGASPASRAAAPSVPAHASSTAESGPSSGRSQRRRSARLNPLNDAELAADEAPTAVAGVTSPSASAPLSPTTLTTSERRAILPAMSMGMDFDDEEDYSEDDHGGGSCCHRTQRKRR
ncbi:E3 ubiquitin-protein ligase TRIP12 [Cryptococcus deuterogattii 99/473]|uniref:HECT-type E3 ubiquitin transferase n=1 Tax=Cryptococcus deuterogattii Ram5 TaxID=1296110 RepID=A0A0D0V8Q0_9TREE|nr:E3 ubiquitin-protein ligase TRIP12 [Cryptococcus deuterogattii LA55]KIR42889.1 E3 ubiquitin-protein ligase TRIP12 [Cryptococcus deuterogattii Ram5]KIR75586.1 E3 ubiquitin-protein ligase TRIP12 [Cryptococcus deuterogattii CA1014]KIR95526.1 E3 ubiquitin-protein ligase TRIP12 [Cryptococcus deuterogattii CBS 10090]KIY59570.1 E3 ubiquitin-protein ligase TRIP12 [Cryptococcus deuterogattii 99/473]